MFGQRVRHSSELDRILRLPPQQPYPEKLEQRLTQILRTPNGEQHLKPVQAQALYEAATAGGLFGSITVGGRETLIRLLCPFVMKGGPPTVGSLAANLARTGRGARIQEVPESFGRIPPIPENQL